MCVEIWSSCMIELNILDIYFVCESLVSIFGNMYWRKESSIFLVFSSNNWYSDCLVYDYLQVDISLSLVIFFLKYILWFSRFSQSFVSYNDWSSWLHVNKFRLFIMHILIISLCATSILFCIHSFFALTNSTTWERVSRHRITYLNRLPNEDLNPFHQGYCRNFFYSFLCHRIEERQWDIVYKKSVGEHVTLNM